MDADGYRHRIVAASTLCVAVAAVYFRVHRFGFINYDDDFLLYRNPHVSTGLTWQNLVWAFTSTERLQWAPVTWISHMVDFEIFGLHPAGHHLVSVGIHCLNVVLLASLLTRMTGALGRSWLVAAAFALHPLQVEPVTWLSARKDLISTALVLIALHSYARYASRPARGAYLAALGWYAASLMAKPMYMTLPLLLVLLDAWPLRRLSVQRGAGVRHGLRSNGRVLIEKLPFAALGAIFAAVSYVAQANSNAVTPFQGGDAANRMEIVALSYGHSLGHAAWPFGQAVIYPIPKTISLLHVSLWVALFVAVSALVVWKAERRPYLPVGWFWFVIGLLPVSGFVRVGSALTADKFMYVPLVGLLIILVWGGWEVVQQWSERVRKAVLAGAIVVVGGLYVGRSLAYLECWRDSKALYTEAISHTHGNFLAMYNLGATLESAGDRKSALKWYWESIQAEPLFESGYASIGNILMKRGDCVGAIPYFEETLRLSPGDGVAAGGLAFCSGYAAPARSSGERTRTP